MEFLDFVNKYKGIVFIWLSSDRKYSITPESGSFVTYIETLDITDIVPFVIDLPQHIMYARFGGRNGTYGVLLSNNITTPRPNETVYEFLNRDV